MRGMVPPDPDSTVSEVVFAVVYEPKRNKKSKRATKRQNKRFSANCVETKDSEEEALAQANLEEKRFAAKVLGPSKSSEGQYIYYLVEWL